MLSLGFTQTTTYGFAEARHLDNLQLSRDDIRRKFVEQTHPLTEKQGVMRTLLLPGLLKSVKTDIEGPKTVVRLFEIGTVYHPIIKGKQTQEIVHICGVLSGSRLGENTDIPDVRDIAEFSDAKKTVERLLEELHVAEKIKGKIEFVHPTQEGVENFCNPDYALLVFAGGIFLGSIGKIDLGILRSFSIKNEVCYFDLNFDAICELEGVRSFSSRPHCPSATRVISLIVDQSVSVDQLLDTIQNSREELIGSCDLLDVFQDNMNDKGRKSVAVTITYRSSTKTLTEKNVEKIHTKIVKLLTDTFGGSFRDA